MRLPHGPAQTWRGGCIGVQFYALSGGSSLFFTFWNNDAGEGTRTSCALPHVIFGGDTRIWTGESGFCRPLPYHLAMSPFVSMPTLSCGHWTWSGQRGSDSLPPPWQGGALPDELCPQMVPRAGVEPATRGFSVLCSTNWAIWAKWRPGTDSNRRPLAWQASVLTNWTTGPFLSGWSGGNNWTRTSDPLLVRQRATGMALPHIRAIPRLLYIDFFSHGL